MTLKNIIALLFILYILFILAFVIINLKSTNIILNNIYVIQLRFDYFLHVAAFLPWAIFVYLLFSKHWVWAFSGLIFAGITESFQLYLPYRTFNINDLIANLSGIIAGYLIIMILRKQITNFKMNIRNHK